MDTLFTVLFLTLCFFTLFLHIFSLPANWILLILVAGWKYFYPEVGLSWWPGFVFLIALALVAEALEFLIQLKGSKKHGATNKGNFGGIIGAIVGAILGAGFLFGFGALIGAIAGAYLGCFLVEKLSGRTGEEARKAAWGAMWGKFFGIITKAGFGGVMLAFVASTIW